MHDLCRSKSSHQTILLAKTIDSPCSDESLSQWNFDIEHSAAAVWRSRSEDGLMPRSDLGRKGQLASCERHAAARLSTSPAVKPSSFFYYDRRENHGSRRSLTDSWQMGGLVMDLENWQPDGLLLRPFTSWVCRGAPRLPGNPRARKRRWHRHGAITLN